jgi:hypothetical protein
MKIDLDKLKNAHQTLKDHQLVTIAQCPACAEEGNDRHKQDHLIVYPDGRFGCAVNPGDAGTEHRKEILRLVGTANDKDPNAGLMCSKRFRPRPINPFPTKITKIQLKPVKRQDQEKVIEPL